MAEPARTRRVGAPRPNTIRLWTIQPIAVWDALQRDPILRVDAERARAVGNYRHWPDAYDWLRGKMRERIAGYAGGLCWWAWFNPKPDLRSHFGRFTPSNEGPYVRLELAVDPETVLLSDFNDWHHVLNGWFLSDDEDDDAADTTRLVASWDAIFTIDPTQSIQATFEELRRADVVAVTTFRPRPRR